MLNKKSWDILNNALQFIPSVYVNIYFNQSFLWPTVDFQKGIYLFICPLILGQMCSQTWVGTGAEIVHYLHQTKTNKQKTNKKTFLVVDGLPLYILIHLRYLTYIYTHICIVYIYMYVCMYVCMYIYLSVYVYLVTTISIFWHPLEAFSCLNLREWLQAWNTLFWKISVHCFPAYATLKSMGFINALVISLSFT